MKIFVDNTISVRIVRALRELLTERDEAQGNQAAVLTHLQEKFLPDTVDPVWLGELAREGEWVILSGDVRIVRMEANLRAWLESGLPIFFLSEEWENMHRLDQAASLLKCWRDFERQARSAANGSAYIIQPRSGGIKAHTPRAPRAERQ
ncbi:MAG: hypothetical protein IPJ95_01130 [Gemmatimonadetes bacterium]|nr:hypothetical protein [Gemmatimonadota bacterium]